MKQLEMDGCCKPRNTWVWDSCLACGTTKCIWVLSKLAGYDQSQWSHFIITKQTKQTNQTNIQFNTNDQNIVSDSTPLHSTPLSPTQVSPKCEVRCSRNNCQAGGCPICENVCLPAKCQTVCTPATPVCKVDD